MRRGVKKNLNLGLDCGFDRTDLAELEMLLKLLRKNQDGIHLHFDSFDCERLTNLVRMRYKDLLTLAAIGDKVGLCQERVRVLINRALYKIQWEIMKREYFWNRCEPDLRVLIKEKVKHFQSWDDFKVQHPRWIKMLRGRNVS